MVVGLQKMVSGAQQNNDACTKALRVATECWELSLVLVVVVVESCRCCCHPARSPGRPFSRSSFIVRRSLLFLIRILVLVPAVVVLFPNEANDETLHSQKFQALRWEHGKTEKSMSEQDELSTARERKEEKEKGR